MTTGPEALKEYAYELPVELIAREPALPRDSSRLLICDTRTGNLEDSRFASLAAVLPPRALLVFNETKVIPARITLAKRTGGRVEVLFYVNAWDRASAIEGIVDRKLAVGDSLFLDGREICVAVSQDANLFRFSLKVNPDEFVSLLDASGVMPIPTYIKETPLRESDLKERYQTTFAKNPGSVAAPTASLHFTPELFANLARAGIETTFLTLHVGAGTFAPVTERELSSGKLHTETFFIPKETSALIARAKREGRPVVAVGTTTLRALESATLDPENDVSSATSIFIRKPYRFKAADGLITNFHVPESSLMCLVDAFLDFKKSPKSIQEIYREAIDRAYRFFSFGDGMLIY